MRNAAAVGGDTGAIAAASHMTLLYALPLLIAMALAWLLVRHARDRRRTQLFRDRLKRQSKRPKLKSRSDSERSEMRAYDDATTVARTIQKTEPAKTDPAVQSADGTRSRTKL